MSTVYLYPVDPDPWTIVLRDPTTGDALPPPPPPEVSEPALVGVPTVLRKALADFDLQMPVALTNVPFEKPENSAPWVQLELSASVASVGSLGMGGLDEHEGQLELRVHVEPDSGDVFLQALHARLAQHFTLGRTLAYGATSVEVARPFYRSRDYPADGYFCRVFVMGWCSYVGRPA